MMFIMGLTLMHLEKRGKYYYIYKQRLLAKNFEINVFPAKT